MLTEYSKGKGNALLQLDTRLTVEDLNRSTAWSADMVHCRNEANSCKVSTISCKSTITLQAGSTKSAFWNSSPTHKWTKVCIKLLVRCANSLVSNWLIHV